jgi:two-component system, response regulator PdtaR
MGALLYDFVRTAGRTMVGARGNLQLEERAKISRTILVVEDEILVRMVISDKLREAGYTVVEAAGSEEALNVLAQLDVKLILSDVQMPGSMDGIGLARVVRSAYPAVKIVLTSGHVDAIRGAEHEGFFSKPCNVAEVIGHIETLLD